MTVVEAYFGGTKFDPYDNTGMMCTSVTALLIEGIAQNTSGSIYEAEVSHFSFMPKAKHIWLHMHPKFYIMVLLFEISIF